MKRILYHSREDVRERARLRRGNEWARKKTRSGARHKVNPPGSKVRRIFGAAA